MRFLVDCESLFLKHVSVKKEIFEREAVVKTMSNSHKKKKTNKIFQCEGDVVPMLCRSVYEKRKLRTVSPSVLNFLWGSVSHFSGCC